MPPPFLPSVAVTVPVCEAVLPAGYPLGRCRSQDACINLDGGSKKVAHSRAQLCRRRNDRVLPRFFFRPTLARVAEQPWLDLIEILIS